MNKRDGARVGVPASPRQQWTVEMWNNGQYEGFKLFPTEHEASKFANNYEMMLAEFRQGKNNK